MLKRAFHQCDRRYILPRTCVL